MRWFACSRIRAAPPHHTWLMARVLCSQSVSVSRLERNERRELIREKEREGEMRGQARVGGGSVCFCYVDLCSDSQALLAWLAQLWSTDMDLLLRLQRRPAGTVWNSTLVSINQDIHRLSSPFFSPGWQCVGPSSAPPLTPPRPPCGVDHACCFALSSPSPLTSTQVLTDFAGFVSRR